MTIEELTDRVHTLMQAVNNLVDRVNDLSHDLEDTPTTEDVQSMIDDAIDSVDVTLSRV